MHSLLKKLAIVVTLSVAVMASEGYIDNDILISPEDAIKLIGDPKVMFVSGDSRDIYKLGHIKGSVEMNAHYLHHADIAGVMHCAPLYRCLDDAEHYIGSKGIGNDTTIIAYDDFKGPNATGVYSFFKSYGHKNVKILNGGRAAIMDLDPAAKNLLAVKGDEHVEAKKYHINKDALDFSYIAGKEELKHAMKDILKKGKDSNYVIVDTRSMDEIIGECKMDNVARGGHIPGATFMEWKKVSDLQNGRSFKSAKALKKVFAHYNITPDKTVYAYSQVGTGRASEVTTALKLLGYKNAKTYSGSWDEWGNDMNLPLNR